MRLLICGIFVVALMGGAVPALAQNSLLSPRTTTAAEPAPTPNPATPLNLQTPDQQKNNASISSEDIPEALLKEVEDVEKRCSLNYFYSSFHDCKCVAVKFLDARLKSDPNTPRSRIENEVLSTCPDSTGVAGYVYKGCAPYMKSVREDYVDYCSCVANDVARAYTRAPLLSIAYIDRLRTDAGRKCGARADPSYNSPYRR